MLEVKCFATLGKYAPPDGKLPFSPGMKVRDVLTLLDIPEKEVKVIFINGKHSSLDTILSDGDRVGIFPAVGGG